MRTVRDTIIAILKEEGLDIITKAKLNTIADKIVKDLNLEKTEEILLSNYFSDMREMFQTLVSCLCDLYKMEPDKYEEDFDTLEAALRKNNNCGCEPYFGILAHGINGYDSLSIDFGCDYHDTLYAEFYDGFSAPYRILTWPKQKVKELFELLKNTAPRLYEKVIENEMNEE